VRALAKPVSDNAVRTKPPAAADATRGHAQTSSSLNVTAVA